MNRIETDATEALDPLLLDPEPELDEEAGVEAEEAPLEELGRVALGEGETVGVPPLPTLLAPGEEET